MSKIGTMTLTGGSGKKYQFNVYPLDTEFKALGAVYYISKRTKKADDTGGTHEQIYIGETGDLSDRFDNHHKEECFAIYEANCVSIHQESDERTRLDIESDLIDPYDPPCNG